MGKTQLVAIEHDDLGNLLASSMYRLVREKVLPHLTQDSVIIVEGGVKRGEMKRDDHGYDIIYRQLGPDIYRSGIYPLLYSDDPMYHMQSKREVLKQWKNSDADYEKISEVLFLRNQPNTWEELIEKIQMKKHDAELRRELKKPLKARLRTTKEEFDARDKAFAEQIQKYEKQDRTVFFFGGILHCVQLAAHYSWTVTRYECSPEVIRNLYVAWYQAYEAPGLLRK
jgi:hypothetical protein